MKAREALKKKTWAVVGDVTNQAKYAYDICEKLEEKNHKVYRINPKDVSDPKVLKSLSDIPEKVDVVNLVINPAKGIDIVKEMKELGLEEVFIQPGAGSNDILEYCEGNNIDVTKGCVLAEYRSMR